jgi:hypothetical protein
MKSLLINVLLVTWVFGNQPDWRVLSIGHSVDFVESEFSRRILDILQSEEYLALYPFIKIREEVKAAKRFQLVSKGAYRAAGAGANIAGFRFKLGIMDDIMSEQTAYSEGERTRINNWYAPGFRTRGLPGNWIINVQTRWHEDDIGGFLQKVARKNPNADQWETYSIPALLDEEAAADLGLEVGTSYWPEMWSTQSLLTTRENYEDISKWYALYMQNPVSPEGNIIKKEHFMTWVEDELPEFETIIMTADTAFSEKQRAIPFLLMLTL